MSIRNDLCTNCGGRGFLLLEGKPNACWDCALGRALQHQSAALAQIADYCVEMEAQLLEAEEELDQFYDSEHAFDEPPGLR